MVASSATMHRQIVIYMAGGSGSVATTVYSDASPDSLPAPLTLF